MCTNGTLKRLSGNSQLKCLKTTIALLFIYLFQKVLYLGYITFNVSTMFEPTEILYFCMETVSFILKKFKNAKTLLKHTFFLTG